MVVQYFWKLVKIFYRENPDKPIAISSPVNTTPQMTKPTVKSTITAFKQKYDQLTKANKTAKHAKNN